MQKLLLIIIYFLSHTVNAQKVTENDLLGTWNIISITEPDMHLDFVANTAKITDKFIQDNPEYSREQLEEMANDRLGYLRESRLTFMSHSLLLMTCGYEEPAYFKYRLVAKGNAQYLVYESTGDMEEIYIRNGLLYKILNSGETPYIEVYQKQKP